ncbi:unnamed protein product, partial [Ectocarpus sp. 12 AP-2014]
GVRATRGFPVGGRSRRTLSQGDGNASIGPCGPSRDLGAEADRLPRHDGVHPGTQRRFPRGKSQHGSGERAGPDRGGQVRRWRQSQQAPAPHWWWWPQWQRSQGRHRRHNQHDA